MIPDFASYEPQTESLAGRTILVTGAGDGIGKAVALALASHGVTVVLLGRTMQKLEAVYDSIEEGGGPQPAIFPMNLEGATNRDYAELAIKLGEEFGCLDGILHNAAELRYLSRLDDYDLEHWFRVMQVNLNGPFMMTQACLPLLRKSGDPSVVFTSDSVGRQGKAYWGAYGVSKFAIEGLMQIMAAENDNKGPRVNSIDPGPVRTALRAAIYPGEDPNDLPAPDEVVKPYLWLLGADSQGVTGQAIG